MRGQRRRFEAQLISALLGAICFSGPRVFAADPQPSLLLDSQKVEVGATVRGSLDLATLSPTGGKILAPADTSVWRDVDGHCSPVAGVQRELSLTAAQLTDGLCWKAQKKTTARLIAKLALPNNLTRWVSGAAVEFYSTSWFDRSFWAGVVTTALGAALTLAATLLTQGFQGRRDRASSRAEGRLAAQKFLAETFFPSISGWREQLDKWDPESPNPPPKLSLSGTYATQESTRAALLATYFKDLGKSQGSAALKRLHDLADDYDSHADVLNSPPPTEDEGKAEVAAARNQAIQLRRQLRELLTTFGY